MNTSDPSQVDSATLKTSLFRDLKEAQHAVVREDYLSAERWIAEARITACELLRRSHLRRVK